MITVIGKEDDYAIMKQVQQLKLAEPGMTVMTLDASTDLSKLASDEALYLIAHGDSGSGDIRNLDRATLLNWLKDQQRGVPEKFRGIVILSCYSGQKVTEQLPSLAKYIALGLAGKAATGTPVAGANGYSYGTPEFSKTRRSSVLPMTLSFFFSPGQSIIYSMTSQWLAHKPTHAGGVLHGKLKITVDQGKTIEANLATIQAPERPLRDIATECVKDFTQQVTGIEGELKSIIQAKIEGGTVASRTEYLVSRTSEEAVIRWNKAIKDQYGLFEDFYLWEPEASAFTTEIV